MMIKLGSGLWVAADTVAEIKVNDRADYLTVRTKDGMGHSVGADYGKSIYSTADRLVAEIDAAIAQAAQ